jgi:hypothetical protein
MAFADLKTYFRSVFQDLGYDMSKEHGEAFDLESIPSTLIDRAFHILSVGPVQGIRQNQADQELSASVTLSVFFQGFRSEEQGRESAMAAGEEFISEALRAKRRVSSFASGIKNVTLENLEAVPLDDSNDNIVKLTMLFTVNYSIGLREI